MGRNFNFNSIVYDEAMDMKGRAAKKHKEESKKHEKKESKKFEKKESKSEGKSKRGR